MARAWAAVVAMVVECDDHQGGSISAPLVIHSVEPEFTEDARRSDLQGTVSIELIVDAQGDPQDVRVVHQLGMGWIRRPSMLYVNIGSGRPCTRAIQYRCRWLSRSISACTERCRASES